MENLDALNSSSSSIGGEEFLKCGFTKLGKESTMARLESWEFLLHNV